MTTIKLDPETEERVKKISKQLGISKEELIYRSILDYLEKITKPSAWDLGQNYFGKYSSGRKNLSRDRKKILREKLAYKHYGKNTDCFGSVDSFIR